MKELTCGSCEHFYQHYALNGRRFFRVCCGHCTLMRGKKKLAEAKACGHYVPGQVDEEAFVTKEYLSKELLRRVLALELLPPIEEEKP